MEFYVPNVEALQKAMVGPRMGREAWAAHFRNMRFKNAKPIEKLTGVAMRLPNSQIRTGEMIDGHFGLYQKAGGKVAGATSSYKPVKGIAAIRLVESDPAWGFRTTQQPFVTRHEARRSLGDTTSSKSTGRCTHRTWLARRGVASYLGSPEGGCTLPPRHLRKRSRSPL